MNWLHPRNFTRSERGWIIGFFLAAAILSTLPYFIFAAQTPPERHYTWASVFYYDDYFQYYAWANHISRGDWLIRNYYTASREAQFGLFNPYFLLLGWMTRITGNVYFAYHLLRVIGIGFFAWISYAFIALFLTEARTRRLAQWLMLGGGLEYPFFLISQSRPATPLADPYVYKVLYRYGHLTAALCFVLIIFGSYVHSLKSKEKPQWSLPFIIAASTLVLGLINPYYVVLVAVVSSAHAIWLWLQGNRSPVLTASAVWVGGAIAYAHYRIQSLSSNLGTISFDDPIGPLDFVLFFSILLPLAIAGWIIRTKAPAENPTGLGFLAVWLVVVFALIFSPLKFEARMVFGLSIALAIPAAYWLARRSLVHPLNLMIYGLLMIDAGFTFYKESLDFHEAGIGHIDKAMLAAFDELDRSAEPHDLVATSGDTGNFIPAYTRANVYIGHSFQTENYYAKVREFDEFLFRFTEAQRKEFLDRIGAKFLFIGPAERRIQPAFELNAWPKVYDESGYTIYAKPESEPTTGIR